ncbi:hypothetical protein ACOTEH_23850 [Achromobacter xylosoxidans]
MLSVAALDKRLNFVRAENLKLLLARSSSAKVPTVAAFARYLGDAGALITESALRNCICGKAPLPGEMAREIEQVLGLPGGWMSVDHSYIFGAAPDVQVNEPRGASAPDEAQQPAAS